MSIWGLVTRRRLKESASGSGYWWPQCIHLWKFVDLYTYNRCICTYVYFDAKLNVRIRLMLCWDLKKSGCLHFPLEFKDGALLSVSVGEGQWHVIHCGTKPVWSLCLPACLFPQSARVTLLLSFCHHFQPCPKSWFNASLALSLSILPTSLSSFFFSPYFSLKSIDPHFITLESLILVLCVCFF